MSDRFIMFNDEQLDAMKMMMLQDLARLLLKIRIHKSKSINFHIMMPSMMRLFVVLLGPST